MSLSVEIADLAAQQWGLITAAQARRLGASNQALARLAQQGGLERTVHGAYRVSGAPYSPFEGLRAAWLLLDPSKQAVERRADSHPFVVSHRSAALILGLGNLDADRHEFTGAIRKQSRRAGVAIYQSKTNDDWSLVDGLPVTTALRTIVDLAKGRTDGGHLATIVRDALLSQQVDDQQLAVALRSYAHYYSAPLGDGQALLKQFLQTAGVPGSVSRTTAFGAMDQIRETLNDILVKSGSFTGSSQTRV